MIDLIDMIGNKKMATRKKADQHSHPKYTTEQMIAALRASGGTVSVAARAVGCSVVTMRRYITDYPEVAEARNEEVEMIGDKAELTLARLALGSPNRKDASKYDEPPNVTALLFMLKTRYKNRGYTERIEHGFDFDMELVKQFIDSLRATGVDAEAFMMRAKRRADEEAAAKLRG